MKRTIAAKQKRGRGRPATGRDPMIGVRVSPELRKAVERWAGSLADKPNLSQAIRRLIEDGLRRHSK